MFQITIFFLYLIAAVLFAAGRLPRYAAQQSMLLITAYITGIVAAVWHAWTLWAAIVVPGGLIISLSNTASFIGLELAITALVGALEKTLRGLVAGLLLLAGITAFLTSVQVASSVSSPMTWQIQSHILTSLFAYGLLTVGAIVALYALVQEKRLQARKLSSMNQLFAPMETTEKLLFGITTGGFLALLVAVLSGVAFVDNLFAQHLPHKIVLSILALILFGALLTARWLAGWRGKRAIYLYLWAFLFLCLAYFGSRFVLEQLLGRSWS